MYFDCLKIFKKANISETVKKLGGLFKVSVPVGHWRSVAV